MKINEALMLRPGDVVSFVGGGGKTSLLFCLASEIKERSRLMITTTTKMYLPPQDLVKVVFLNGMPPLREEIKSLLFQHGQIFLANNTLEENKAAGLTLDQVSRLAGFMPDLADIILVEADGSKQLPLKGHLPFEPVVPPSTTVLVVAIGADALGSPLDGRHVHRPEEVARLTGLEAGSLLDAPAIARLIKNPQGVIRSAPAHAAVVPFINKTDLPGVLEKSRELARLLLGGRVDRVLLGSALDPDPVAEIIRTGGICS